LTQPRSTSTRRPRRLDIGRGAAARQRILDFIKDFIGRHGYPPSIRDIQRGCNISSTSVVAYHLKALEEQGLLQRDREVSRGLGLRGVAVAEPSVDVPMLGAIAAGAPVPVPSADTWRPGALETVGVPQTMTGGKPAFALRVRGDSMIDALINDGDLVIMEPTSGVENGQMAAVWLKQEQETTLKRFYHEGARVRLQPENPYLEPRFEPADNVEIQGRVIGVLRQYN
jgi:repressor LexA